MPIDGKGGGWWTQADGKRIKITKMRSGHIRNCMFLLKRSLAGRLFNAYRTVQMSKDLQDIDDAEKEIMEIENHIKNPTRFYPVYAEFREELIKRGIWKPTPTELFGGTE